jgi:AmmeMemoRadiSam system protein B
MDEMQLGPTVAGSWYPDQRASLERQIDALLSAGGDEEAAEAEGTVAIIVPHAGLIYSGAVAGRGFSLVKDLSYERVILLGPSHHAFFQGAAVPGASCYATPLGRVPLDREAIAGLEEEPGIESDDRPFLPEHCLEMEIPFLQRALVPGWRLLPLLIGGGSSPAGCDLVARALRPLIDAATLIVVSTDFTHYGPRFSFVPFTTDVPGRLRELDMGAVDRILVSDKTGFTEYVKRTGATICGRNAIEVLLSLLPQPIESSLVDYDTSGNITGEWDHSVSYVSLEFHTGS